MASPMSLDGWLDVPRWSAGFATNAVGSCPGYFFVSANAAALYVVFFMDSLLTATAGTLAKWQLRGGKK